MYLYNSKFKLEHAPNDFDPLARVVRITEIGNTASTTDTVEQKLCVVDMSSIYNLRDAIDNFIEEQFIVAEEQQLDQEAVNAYIAALVEAALPSAVEAYNRANQPPPTRTQQQEAQEELKRTLDPFIQPDLQRANFTAANAIDKVTFLVEHPEYKTISPQVEETFDNLQKQGRAIPRLDIAHYILGKMSTQEPEKFKEYQSERQKQQVREVEGATDFGQGALEKAKSDPVWSNVRNMSIEDLEKALDGVTF